MTIDELTKNIDKLWIASVREFKPNDIEFKGVGIIKRDTTLPLAEICKKTDCREYLVGGKEVYIDYSILGGWTGVGYSNTYDGYDSQKYLAFKDGCLGKDAPENPEELSYKKAKEVYGRFNIDMIYGEVKQAYDLGVKAAKKWPEFLKVD